MPVLSSPSLSRTGVLIKLLLLSLVMMLMGAEGSVDVGQAPRGCGELGVSITVSSLLTTTPPRQLQLSWWNADPQPGDYVTLHHSDPHSRPSRPLAERAVDTPAGHAIASIQALTSAPPGDTAANYTSRCLGYWVAYIRNHTLVMTSSCLRTQPSWMHDLRSELGHLTLKHMFLPGTHDSAAYKLYAGEARETRVTKYSITQEEDVHSQLVHGVRYLDLRVGYYKREDPQWWANHGVLRIHPLVDIFAQIKQFMRATKEIVILDMQEFNPGFKDNLEVHLKLVQLLVTELGPYMALPSLTWNSRLEDLWRSGGRLIVTYDHLEVVAASTLLWPAVEHRWGNVQTVQELRNHMHRTMQLQRLGVSKPWAAMAELTPTAWSLVTDKLGGLRQMAHAVNRNVTEWFRGTWGARVNVVAVDFFRGTDIVEDAILWNRRRARQITCAPPV